MSNEIAQNKMISTLVTIIIAVVLVGLVMAPIINSIGGNGGDSDTSTVVVTNSGTTYALADATDSTVHTFFVGYDDTSIIAILDDVPIDLGLTYTGHDTELTGYVVLAIGNGAFIQGFSTPWSLSVANNGYIYAFMDPGEGDTPTYDSSFEKMATIEEIFMDGAPPVTIHDGKWDFTMLTGMLPSTECDLELYLSESGTYVMCEDAKVLPTAEIYVAYSNMDANQANTHNTLGYREYPAMLGMGTYTTLVPSTLTNFNTAYGTTELELVAEENANYIILDELVCTFYDSYGLPTYTLTAPQFFVPASFSYSEGGADSENTGSGVAYQILMLMPLLVIVSLIAVLIKPYLIDRYL